MANPTVESGAIAESAPEGLNSPPQEEHEPSQDHPRFKEVYGKMKTYERQSEGLAKTNEELKSDIEAMKEHNQALADSMGNVESQLARQNRPDPTEDPDGYAEWTVNEAQRRLKVNQKVVAPKKEPAKPVAKGINDPREIVMLAQKDDYLEVIEDVRKDLDSDPVLRNDIMSELNPFKAAYEYGIKKKASRASRQEGNINQGFVEGGGLAPDPSKATELSAQEKRVASALGIPEDKYLAQRNHIRGVK